MRYLKLVFLVALASVLMSSGTRKAKLTEGIQAGNLAPDFELQGMKIEKDKYVLLQFWAACRPESRVENVMIHNALSAQKEKSIQLISISMDNNPSVFEGAVRADRLADGTQFNDPQGSQSPIYEKFRLKKGFSNWLIGPGGIIVAKDLSPEELRELMIND